jgi:hypothetical protein
VDGGGAPAVRLRLFADFVVVGRDLCQGHVYSSVEASPLLSRTAGLSLETEAAVV